MIALELMKSIKEPRKTCKHGHPWVRRNIYRNKNRKKGSYCKVCCALACRKWYAANRRAVA